MNFLFITGSIVSILFSLTCFVPQFSFIFLGFILSFLFSGSVFIYSIRFLKNQTRKQLSILRKLLEYLPFVLFACFIISRAGPIDFSFFIDVLAVLLWLCSTTFSFILLFKLSDKRIQKVYPAFPDFKNTKKKFIIHLIEWVDALVQAACLVLLINLFLFQLYAIPSESMVPEFMIGDRVVVFKTPSGPKFPLSKAGVPQLKSYSRGDIVVFTNPHYNDTKKDKIQSFVSQLVYMLSFTSVNINKDEYGELKADPLVKRIVGVPGEKLMMVDGVLYSKKKGSTQYEPIEEEQKWATWNVDALPQSQKKLIARIPMSQEAFTQMESVESLRANANIEELAREAHEIVEQFNALRPIKDSVVFVDTLVSKNKREIFSLFQSNDEITKFLLTTNGGGIWFKKFLTDWTQETKRNNLFDERSFKLNILIKINFGKLVLRNTELFLNQTSIDSIVNDHQRKSLLMEAEQYRAYLAIHDQRNMGEFPEGTDNYIPDNAFFMMGDNRFNSLDMRHSYSISLNPVDSGDEWSILYKSNLAPQYVCSDKILGLSSFRFWPLSRMGKPE